MGIGLNRYIKFKKDDFYFFYWKWEGITGFLVLEIIFICNSFVVVCYGELYYWIFWVLDQEFGLNYIIVILYFLVYMVIVRLLGDFMAFIYMN